MRRQAIKMAAFATLGMITVVTAGALAQDSARPLPVDRVVLSTAGLAHIEHSVTVTGNAAVVVPVRLDQVDDVMKSLVIFDAKGSLGAVTLPGRQPLAEAFRDLPFTQSALADPVLLLNSYQGAGLTLSLGGKAIDGKLIAVTPEQIVHDNGSSETRYRIALMTAEGMKRLWLDDVQALQFDDAGIKDEIARALAAVRQNAASGQRALTVALKGDGPRAVRLGYVIEAPLWKAAYRLVLPAAGEKNAQGLLQGWAVVENMTASDWNNVDLTLVSGNPVTFRQQLYQSYHVDRPEVPVEVLGRVMPRMDAGSVGTAAVLEREAGLRGEAPMRKAKGARSLMLAAAPPMPQAMASQEMAMDSMGGAEMAVMADQGFDAGADTLAAGAIAAASAEATTQVLFHFADRLTLPAGQSLLIPFTAGKMEMARVSVYQPDTHPRHPLAAVELHNAADSGLPPGVLTIYEDNTAMKGTSYVGDARLPALAAGEKRLVSYALDSKVTVDRTATSDTVEGKVTMAGGVIKSARTVREKTVYALKAPPHEARRVIIEHPRRGDFTLVAPKAEEAEVTDGYYRIAVDLAAGEEKAVPVVLERVLWQSYAVDNLGLDDLLAYAATRGDMDAKVRKVFARLAEVRRGIDALDASLAQLAQERQMIFADQSRVRDNLRSLTGASDLRDRYQKKLDEQETRIADIDEETVKLQGKRAERAAELRRIVADAQDAGD